MEFEFLKLEIFIPETHFTVLQKALQNVDAGHIGNYDSCLSVSKVKVFWIPLDGAKPFIGNKNEISCETELKVEVTIKRVNLQKTLKAIKAVHPYEEPVINVLALLATGL